MRTPNGFSVDILHSGNLDMSVWMVFFAPSLKTSVHLKFVSTRKLPLRITWGLLEISRIDVQIWVREAGAGGSNPLTPTSNRKGFLKSHFSNLFSSPHYSPCTWGKYKATYNPDKSSMTRVCGYNYIATTVCYRR